MAAYSSGVFPMPLNDSGFRGEMGWWSPVQRGVVELARLRVSRSLAKTAKRYLTSIDLAFERVIRRCADPRRPLRLDRRRHRVGLHPSCTRQVRCTRWRPGAQGRLVGGLYGVSMGGLFAGESMFHDPEHGRDASKVAGSLRLVGNCAARPDRHGTARRASGSLIIWRASGASRDHRRDYLRRLRPPWNGRTPSGRCRESMRRVRA